MGDFLWINREAGSGSLTGLKEGEHQALRSFVQQKRLPAHHNVKREEQALPSGIGSEAADDDQSKLQGRGRRRRSNVTSAQAAMQASWRLGSSIPHPRQSMRNKRQVLFRRSHESLARPAHTPSVDTGSHVSRRRRQPELRREYATREADIVRESNLYRGEFQVLHLTREMSY